MADTPSAALAGGPVKAHGVRQGGQPGHGPFGIVHPQWRTSVAEHPGASRASLRGGRRDIDCSIHDAEGKAMKSLPERIMEHAEAMPEATPICPAALLDLGQRAPVGQALSRLARSGRLMRIRQGVYMRPIESRFGRCAPGIEKSLQALSELWTTTPRSGSCTAGFTRCGHSAWALGSARATIRATPPPRPSRPSPYRRDSHPTCPPATASRIHARTAVQQVTSRLGSSPSITVRASRSAASTYIP